MDPVLAPSITVLPAKVAGRVIVTGSHGGLYPGHLVLTAQARAAIFNDAGIGRDRAGVAALDLLQQHGKAAAAVSHSSARIGDTDDMVAGGTISTANALATACGVIPGMSCAAAATLLGAAPLGAPAIAAALRTEGFAAVFNDAGIGKDDAGIARLPALDDRGIAAFTVAASSARIGDARSTLCDGVISRVNRTAAARGARIGQHTREICLLWAR
jgi:hypothetical protein